MKKVSFILLTLFLFLASTVYAEKTTLNHAYWGSDSGIVLWDTYSNDYWEGIQLKGTGTGKIELYDIDSQYIYDMNINLNNSEGWYRFGLGNTGVKGIKFVMTSGTVWAVYADTTNYTINFTQPTTPPPDPDPPPPDDGGGTTDPPPDTGGTTPATMTLSGTDNGDGSSDLTWSPVSGAVSYELYIDGVKSEYTNQVTTVTKDGSGTAYVKAIDSAGNVIGQSNTITFESTGGTGGGTDPGTGDGGTDPTTCGECEKLAEMLACPEWETYVGDLSNAIADALPPPPDWAEVAQEMKSAIVPPLVAAIQDNADQISGQVQQTGNQITDQVDRTGKEIINALGNAIYDGNSRLNTPTMNPYSNPDVPNLADKDLPQAINENINENVPVFEVLDETETIDIPDPMAWESPAVQAKPTPNPNLEVGARPTLPAATIEKTTTGSKSVIPSGDPALSPRETTPTDTGGKEPDLTDPGAKDTVPTDWNNTTTP